MSNFIFKYLLLYYPFTYLMFMYLLRKKEENNDTLASKKQDNNPLSNDKKSNFQNIKYNNLGNNYTNETTSKIENKDITIEDIISIPSDLFPEKDIIQKAEIKDLSEEKGFKKAIDTNKIVKENNKLQKVHTTTQKKAIKDIKKVQKPPKDFVSPIKEKIIANNENSKFNYVEILSQSKKMELAITCLEELCYTLGDNKIDKKIKQYKINDFEKIAQDALTNVKNTNDNNYKKIVGAIFEIKCATLYLKNYSNIQYRGIVLETEDSGIDLIIYYRNYTIFIQCKYKSKVNKDSTIRNKITLQEVIKFKDDVDNYLKRKNTKKQYRYVYAISSYDVLNKKAYEYIKNTDKYTYEIINYKHNKI